MPTAPPSPMPYTLRIEGTQPLGATDSRSPTTLAQTLPQSRHQNPPIRTKAPARSRSGLQQGILRSHISRTGKHPRRIEALQQKLPLVIDLGINLMRNIPVLLVLRKPDIMGSRSHPPSASSATLVDDASPLPPSTGPPAQKKGPAAAQTETVCS
jgi:hypothetical protein